MSCAIDEAGGVWCWGKNDARQLGFESTGKCTQDGVTYPCQPTPKKVDGVPASLDVQSGALYTCALTTAHAVWCWGTNVNGQSGQSPATSTPLAPAPVLAPLTDGVEQIATGHDQFTVAVRGNKAYTWGGSYAGSLGRTISNPTCPGGVPCDPTPGAVRAGPDGSVDLIGIAEVRIGDSAGIARTTDGKLVVWGNGHYGLLHDGNGEEAPNMHYLPFGTIVADAPKADAIDLVTTNACLRSGGDVYCWGSNHRGQAGTGNADTFDCVNQPTACVGKMRKVALPGAVSAIATGRFFAAALMADGSVMAWGDNSYAQMGRLPGGSDVDFDGGQYGTPSPVKIEGLPPLR